MKPASALVVLVPEAEPLLADLRLRFDPSAAEGVPAHVTVLYPFVPPHAVTDADLAALTQLCAGLPAFDCRFARVGRFAATAWLAPEPAAPFIALTRAVMARFPGLVPYDGRHPDIVPHLTVADGLAADADVAQAQLEERLARQGPVQARCRELALLDNRGGRWALRQAFALRA